MLLGFKDSLQFLDFFLLAPFYIVFSKTSSHTCVPGIIFCVPSPLPLSLNTFVLFFFPFNLQKGLSFLDILCMLLLEPDFYRCTKCSRYRPAALFLDGTTNVTSSSATPGYFFLPLSHLVSCCNVNVYLALA